MARFSNDSRSQSAFAIRRNEWDHLTQGNLGRGTFMPFSFELDSPNGILLGRFEGQVTDEELSAYCRDSTECIASIDPRAGITDLSAVTSFEVSPQTIIELARVRPAIPGQDPVRIIIAESPHV